VSKLANYSWPEFPDSPPVRVRAAYAEVFVEMARGLQQLVEGFCISRFMVMSVIATNTFVKQGTSQTQIADVTKMDRRTIRRRAEARAAATDRCRLAGLRDQRKAPVSGVHAVCV
jgi:hypothetical protein